jgi:membrane protein YdbS with pleckstrin-like domain
MTETLLHARTAEPAATRVQATGVFPTLPISLGPDPALMKYYLLSSFLLGPAFFIALVPYYFRYATMRYQIDAEGISMRWGILFRREISLTYARIQDIHLSSNFVERWLGLAKIQVQTASGSASAEMTIEGLKDFEAIRDFLYSRMRGAREPTAIAAAGTSASPQPMLELTEALRAVAAEVRALRESLPPRSPGQE